MHSGNSSQGRPAAAGAEGGKGRGGRAASRRGAICLGLWLACAGAAASAAAPAQDGAGAYPDRPITLVVGFPPGGENDRLARELGNDLSARLKTSVIIENRPGANGEIAAAYVSRARPDGHTLLFSSSGALVISPAIKASLPYDPAVDLAPVLMLAESPMLLATSVKSSLDSLETVLRQVREKPGSVTFASAGVGNPTHLAGELVRHQAKVDLLHVPFSGGGAALVALEGQHVDLFFGGVSNVLPQVRAGKLRPLAVTSPRRLEQLPAVPAVNEVAPELKNYQAVIWYGVLAPAGTPAAVTDLLARQLTAGMEVPQLKQRLAASGSQVMPLPGERFRAYMKEDRDRWAEIIAASGLRQ